MAAAVVQRDVLQMFYGPPPKGRNLPQPIVPQRQAPFEDFVLARNNFHGWLNVWRMEPLPERHYNQGDIYRFRRAHKIKFVEVVKNELERLGSIKVSFALKARIFKRKVRRVELEERDHEKGQIQIIKHYFERDQPTIIMRGEGEKRIKQKFEDFIEMIKRGTDNWSEAGSGWIAGDIDLAYINVARYQPLRGGTYLPLPASLAKKKAIINVRNTDNECLKWAIRAELFPPQKQMDRLEAQNRNLAINVYGWEKKIT